MPWLDFFDGELRERTLVTGNKLQVALFSPVSYILSTFSSPYSRTETVVGLLVLNGIGLSVPPEMNSADGRDLLFWLPLGSKKVEENGKQTLCWELAL